MRYIFVIFILVIFFESGIAQKIKISEPVHFLALGDSYTIGQSVEISESWPRQFAFALSYKGFNVQETKIIAQTGWRTDNLASEIIRQQPLTGYNLVSLLIGVNNQYQGGNINTYATEFEELLKTAIVLAGNSPEHVFVLSIPDYAYTPFGKGNSVISSQIDQFNAVNRQITEKYNVKYVDITPVSRNGLKQPELVASDGLHPSGKMYALWVEEIMKNIEKELGLNEQSVELESISFAISHRQLSIKSEKEEADLVIYNTNGSRVQKALVSKNRETNINLSELPAGIYFIQLRNKSKVIFNRKIVLS